MSDSKSPTTYVDIIARSMSERRPIEVRYDALLFDEILRNAKGWEKTDTAMIVYGNRHGWKWSVCFLGCPFTKESEQVRYWPARKQ